MIPSRQSRSCNSTARSATLRAPILASTRQRCTSTVRIAMPSVSAICLFNSPAASAPSPRPRAATGVARRCGQASRGLVLPARGCRCGPIARQGQIDDLVVVERLFDESRRPRTSAPAPPAAHRHGRSERSPAAAAAAGALQRGQRLRGRTAPSIRTSRMMQAQSACGRRVQKGLARGPGPRRDPARGEEEAQGVADGCLRHRRYGRPAGRPVMRRHPSAWRDPAGGGQGHGEDRAAAGVRGGGSGCPRCSSTIERQMFSPMPMPCGLGRGEGVEQPVRQLRRRCRGPDRNRR